MITAASVVLDYPLVARSKSMAGAGMTDAKLVDLLQEPAQQRTMNRMKPTATRTATGNEKAAREKTRRPSLSKLYIIQYK
jgi:hypothetical protein